MRIKAHITNSAQHHEAIVATNGSARHVAIPPRDGGNGSSINGGELLFLALATCYCNDVYREARAAGLQVEAVEVEVEGDFGGIGEAARNIVYRARATCHETDRARVEELLRRTDAVAEIQNTLRNGAAVELVEVAVFPKSNGRQVQPRTD
jgi:organic hydroperoxide reductase OsmC/OhrA